MKSQLDKAGIQWDLHLFADTVNTEASDIATIIQKTAQKVQAELVVLAHHNKVFGNMFVLLYRQLQGLL